MEVINLNKDIILKIQKLMAYGSIIIALAIFLMAIGFMTNLHVLLFNGTNDMFQYYKSVQVLNKSMFNISVVYVIYAFLLLLFDLHKLRPGIFSLALVIGGSTYTFIQSFTMFKYVPYFRNLYVSFDFSVIKDYNPSPWIFDVSRILFGIWDVLAIILLITVVLNYIKVRKEIKLKSQSRGAHYES